MIRIIVAAIVALLVGACAVQRSGVYYAERLKIGKTSRQEVAALFGEPQKRTPRLFSYDYKVWTRTFNSHQLVCQTSFCKFMRSLKPSWEEYIIDEWLEVGFDPKGTVNFWITSDDRGENPDSLKRLCIAARHQRARAQDRLGDYLAFRDTPPRNPARAYMWYVLAKKNGFLPQPDFSESILSTKNEIEKARKLVSAWTPGSPCP